MDRELMNFSSVLLAATCASVVTWSGVVLAAPVPPGERVEFNRDIRPILSNNCFFCHGPDKSHRKAGLRLDLREAALAEGAIVPGKPDESELWSRLTTTDKDDAMPPEETHKVVTAAQREVLKRWISEGAEYQAHWSYV